MLVKEGLLLGPLFKPLHGFLALDKFDASLDASLQTSSNDPRPHSTLDRDNFW